MRKLTDAKWRRSFIRNVVGYGLFTPALILGIAVQTTIVGPIFKNYTTIPNLFFKSASRLLGIRFEFNKASHPIVTDRPTMFVANHLSRVDFGLGPMVPRSSFMMNEKFFNMPYIGWLIKRGAKASGIIPTPQSKEGKKRDQGNVIELLEGGRNVTLFPEGVQSVEMLQYSKGSAEVLFGEKGKSRNGGDVQLERRDVSFQPIVLRVREINGKNVLDKPDQWEPYCMINDYGGLLKRIWERAKVGNIVVDVMALPPMDPSDYDSAEDLMNAAQKETMQFVTPHQTAVRTRKQYLAGEAAKKAAASLEI